MTELVDSIDISYYETSSKHDINVTQLFEHIASDFCGIPYEAPLIASKAKSARK